MFNIPKVIHSIVAIAVIVLAVLAVVRLTRSSKCSVCGHPRSDHTLWGRCRSCQYWCVTTAW